MIAPALIRDRHRDEPDVTFHTENSDATTASRREALVAPLVIMGLGSLLASYPALAEEEELLEARPAAPLLAGGKVSDKGHCCACWASWPHGLVILSDYGKACSHANLPESQPCLGSGRHGSLGLRHACAMHTVFIPVAHTAIPMPK